MSKVLKITLENKIVAVTGGYGHLGKSIVDSLLAHGATVYVLARSEDKFKAVFSPDTSSQVFFSKCDVSSRDSISEAFSSIEKKEKRIDVLVNNAFYSKGNKPERIDDEDWKFAIDGTLNSVFRCIDGVSAFMKEKKSGKIINVSSMYGVIAPDFRLYDESPDFLNPPQYGAAKAAVLQLTRYYASFLGKFGITVNSITPGPFPSPAVQEKDSRFINDLSNRTCLGRIGAPEDLGGAFVFLASDAAGYITGQNLIIDGGWTVR